jgi:hypothetical protein
MVKLIVGLLLKFPKMAELLLKVRDEYAKEIKSRRHKRSDDRINRWLHDD